MGKLPYRKPAVDSRPFKEYVGAFRESPAHALTLGSDGRVSFASKATDKMFGGNVIGKHYSELFPDRSNAARSILIGLGRRAVNARKTGKPIERSILVRRNSPDGPVESFLRMVVTPKGGRVVFHAALTDVSELVERNELVTDIFGINERINSETNLNNVMQAIATHAAEHFGAKVIVAKIDGKELVPHAAAGFDLSDLVKRGPIRLGEGLLGRAASDERTIRADGTKTYNGVLFPDIDRKYNLGSAVAIPLFAYNGKNRKILVGVIGLYKQKDEGGFRDYQLSLMNLIAKNSALKIRNIELKDRMEHLAYHNPVTDLPNRRYFYEKLNEYLGLGRVKREMEPQRITNLLDRKKVPRFGIIKIDLKNLNRANTVLGHEETNELLRNVVGKSLEEVFNEGIIDGELAHVHGDEFNVMVRNPDEEKMEEFCERAKQVVEGRIGDAYPKLVGSGIGLDYGKTIYDYGELGERNGQRSNVNLTRFADLVSAILKYREQHQEVKKLNLGGAVDLLLAYPELELQRRKGKRKRDEGYWPPEAVRELVQPFGVPEEEITKMAEKHGITR
ncbi:hypothetical protein COT29_01565 [Candidatus Micrarchaeota archaeon CG08_land_8_20_14_0_20_59_11]|nr:MAG: hypothetical protein COT29_01565 [Candidatus Micrarchaeota archaeon CG08_land_8_20_14_0_20_59_11]